MSCKNRKSACLSEDKLRKLKQADIFLVPVMNGNINREWFARGAKIRALDTDWTTIQDAFDLGVRDVSNGANELDGSNEVDILQHESLNRPNTQSHSRLSVSSALAQPLHTSTPNKDQSLQLSRNSGQFNDSRSPVNPNNISFPDLKISVRRDLYTPPSNFQDSFLAPPAGFENAIHDDFGVPNVVQPAQFEYCNSENESQVNENNSPPIECSELAELLGDDSFEYANMQKLLKLWQKNVHPIKVDSLLALRCNRFLAARTFNSLLSKCILI